VGDIFIIILPVDCSRWGAGRKNPFNPPPPLVLVARFTSGHGTNKLYAIKTDSKGLAKIPWPMLGRMPGIPVG
jgi:hypothetical protein